MNFFRQNI